MSTYLWYTLYAILGIIVLSIAKATRTALLIPLHKIPGPLLNAWTPIPLLYHFFLDRKFHYTHSLHSRYGPIVRTTPNEIAICEVKAVHDIHRIGSGYAKGAMYARFEVAGTMLCLVPPREHAARRKYFANAFRHQSLAEWDRVVVKNVEDAIAKIRTGARGDGGVDVLGPFSNMATDIVAEICFGDMFSESDPKQEAVLKRIRKQLLSGRNLKIPMPEMIAKYGSDDLKEKIVTEYDGNQGVNKPQTLLARALADNESGILSDEIVAMESKAFMVAGTDTTATTLTYLVWAVLLPKHASIKSRLLAELAALPENFTVRDVESCQYLEMVIKETLRLFGAVASGLPRVVPKGGKELCGYFVPEGTTVTTQSWSVHRNGKVFADPLRFLPERWEKPTPGMKESFMPFGIGSRACIGRHLAEKELLLGAALFFRDCPGIELAPSMKEDDMEVMDRFISHPKSGKCMVVMR